MGPLDSAAKVILREVPRDLVALAPALAGRRVLSAKPDDTVLPAFSLTMDKVLRLEAESEAGELALHVEIEANWGSHVPRKTHGYWTLAHRVHEELWSLVIVLKPGSKQGAPQARYQRQAWGRHALTFDFDVVKVWELDPDDLLRRAIPGQLPLVPYAGGATEGHVERAFEALDRVTPEERRGELQAARLSRSELGCQNAEGAVHGFDDLPTGRRSGVSTRRAEVASTRARDHVREGVGDRSGLLVTTSRGRGPRDS